MGILSVFIINKAGGLVYHQDYGTPAGHCSINEYLALASTFQSLHAISSQIAPVPGSSGIEGIECESFKLFCLQPMTGVKFLLMTDHAQPHTDSILRRIYEIYVDFALKNPFHTLEMPIKSEAFVQKLSQYIRAFSI